jgi:hypothetical protein
LATATATATAVAATGALAAPLAAITAPASASATTSAAAATTTLTRCGLVDADHAAHPLHILEVIDGPCLGSVISQFNKGKAALPACVAVEGEAALAHFAVLAEEIKQILAFCLEREVADVDGHSIKKPGTDSTDVRVHVGKFSIGDDRNLTLARGGWPEVVAG